MRSLPLLLITLAALGSGCLDDAAPAPPPGNAPADARRTETQTLTILQPLGVAETPAGVAGGSSTFEAPAGTVAIRVEVEWNCISICPMRVALVAPDETVVAEESRGYDVELVADPASPGWWTLRWAPRDAPNVGIHGEATVTFTIAA